MSEGQIILLVVVLAVAIPGVWLIAIYNRFVGLKNHVRDSWAGIDVELKRRYDLIPNLVETVKGYARHEQETLARVVELRNRAAASSGSAQSQAQDETALQMQMKRLFAIAEAYPDLKADAGFRHLQEELANTEDRIAASRRFYNANVREMNEMCQSFPTSLVARLFGFETQTYFNLSDEAERVVPRAF